MSAVEKLNELLATPVKEVSDDARVVLHLLEQYRVLGEEEKHARDSREAVKKLLLMYLKDDEIVADGETVATYRTEYRTYLATDKFKELFPQAEYPDMYSIVPVQTFRVTNRGN